MSIDEMIAVLQAAKAGKQIEFKDRFRLRSDGPWQTPESLPTWNFAFCDYRVKPEPRELWLQDIGHGLWQTKWAGSDSSPNAVHFKEVL